MKKANFAITVAKTVGIYHMESSKAFWMFVTVVVAMTIMTRMATKLKKETENMPKRKVMEKRDIIAALDLAAAIEDVLDVLLHNLENTEAKESPFLR